MILRTEKLLSRQMYLEPCIAGRLFILNIIEWIEIIPKSIKISATETRFLGSLC